MTSSGCIYRVEKGHPELVFEGATEGDLRLIAHPTRDLIIIAGTNEIRLMNTQKRGQFLVRTNFETEKIASLTFRKNV